MRSAVRSLSRVSSLSLESMRSVMSRANPQKPVGRPSLVLQQEYRHIHVPGCALPVPDLALEALDGLLGPEYPVEHPVDRCCIRVVHELSVVPAREFLRGIARYLSSGIVAEEEVPVEVHLAVGLVDVVYDVPVLLLAPAQVPLGLLAEGAVARHPHDADALSRSFL